MLFFLYGLAALVAVLLALHWFKQANPSVMAHQLKIIAGLVFLGLGALLLLRGLIVPALALGLIGAWTAGWLGWTRFGGAVTPVTSGKGIEWSPVMTSDGKAVAFFRSDAKLPARAASWPHSAQPAI